VDDAPAFAERTLALLADPTRRCAIAAAARRDALERFGLRQHAAAIMGVYDAMLSPERTGQNARAGRGRGAADEAGPEPRPIQLRH
jgi:hypothetical protein